MSRPIEISDDDDSMEEFEPKLKKSPRKKCKLQKESILLSSDNEENEPTSSSICNLTSDEEDELPDVNLQERKSQIIKQLFPYKGKPVYEYNSSKNVPSASKSFAEPSSMFGAPKQPGVSKMIGGVSVQMPVEPYGCQIALMSKIITGIKRNENCLLESPTGSGKTLALLCGALAWQRHERARISQMAAQEKATTIPELNALDGAVDYIGSVPHVNFDKTTFGERSIYDSPVEPGAFNKGGDPIENGAGDTGSQVKIHDKRRRLNSPTPGANKQWSPGKCSTPQKSSDSPKAETPENVSVPTIFYGARTHKQLQQVIKEFKRTAYCGEAKMTILSSREYSCIREFDRKLWSNKNDMCRMCIKTIGSSDSKKSQNQSNCKFYDNRQALNHKTMPPGFDLDDLVMLGEKNNACPYYAAKSMANSAHIVFCPYNYLIEPSIRSSMQINLQGNILIIDEAHNIEDICRDSASFAFTRDQVQAALSELEKLSGYLFSGQEIYDQVKHIEMSLKSWNEWFGNQLPLVLNRPVNNNEAVFTWNTVDWAQTLDHHNLGQNHYFEFKRNGEAFCQRLREDPRVLLGISQSTGTLVESLCTVLTYIFRSGGQYMDDFKPALVRTVTTDQMSDAVSWRNSQFDKKVQKELLELRLMCMNPAIVFEELKTSRCIVLASGTLTPLHSLYSELDAQFPLKVSPNHVISSDRVWVGTLSTCPDGTPLECKSTSTGQAGIQDALGQALLWVTSVTPGGVLCFLPSYQVLSRLTSRWKETGLWQKLKKEKDIFMESRNVRDHNDIMEGYYESVESSRGAMLFAVFRGKVSEGMDFKDHQARAVVTIGIPYPNTYDMAVKEKMNYNNKYEKKRNLLSSGEWLRVQAYRALNQAVGRCVRHRRDWGAVLMVDSRFINPYYTEHLSGWVRGFLNNNHHTFNSLVHSANSLESFMQGMTLTEKEDL